MFYKEKKELTKQINKNFKLLEIYQKYPKSILHGFNKSLLRNYAQLGVLKIENLTKIRNNIWNGLIEILNNDFSKYNIKFHKYVNDEIFEIIHKESKNNIGYIYLDRKEIKLKHYDDIYAIKKEIDEIKDNITELKQRRELEIPLLESRFKLLFKRSKNIFEFFYILFKYNPKDKELKGRYIDVMFDKKIRINEDSLKWRNEDYKRSVLINELVDKNRKAILDYFKEYGFEERV